MAFKLTYSDGQESQHDDDTVWELDDGVLKLGRTEGQWSVLLSPSHWAVLELVGSNPGDTSEDSDDSDDSKDSEDSDDSDDSKDSDASDDERGSKGSDD